MPVRWTALAVLAVLAACGSRTDVQTTAEPTDSSSTSTTATTTSVPTTSTVPPPAPPVTASATESGIELTLTVEHGIVDVGTRVWADLVIGNVGDDVVYWQAGGCAIPGSITLTPADGAAEPEAARGWDGDPSTFTAWVAAHNALAQTIRLDDEAHVGLPSVACPADSHMKALAPGETLTQRAAADVRMAPGDLPSMGRYVARAAFTSYARPEDYGSQETEDPRPLATVSVPIEVRDDGARTDGEAAVAAFGASDDLRSFVERTKVDTVANSWATALSWWRGAWELSLTPYFGEEGMQVLRLRYDPARDAIVDARVIWDGQAPEDDPDARCRPGARPDDVSPRPGP